MGELVGKDGENGGKWGRRHKNKGRDMDMDRDRDRDMDRDMDREIVKICCYPLDVENNNCHR